MARETVEPTIKKSETSIHDTTMTHPAFAQVSVRRTSGRAVLYGSDFVHQHFITLSIGPSELNRSLARDWPHGSLSKYIEIEMSEAQFASMICNMNVGEGEQCTLTRLNGKSVPGLPAPIRRVEQFKAEADRTLQGSHSALNELDELLASSGLSAKKLEALKWKVEQARRSIGGSLDFVAKQFGEHMEKTVEKAKIEVSAYVTGAIHRAGLEHLGVKPILLQGESEGTRDAGDE